MSRKEAYAHTSGLLARRMLTKTNAPVGEFGEPEFLIAHPDDTLSSIFERAGEIGYPFSICTAIGTNTILSIIVESGEGETVEQDCGPEASLAMLIERLSQTPGQSVTIRITDPVHFSFRTPAPPVPA